jgi:hypothetical protein
MKQIIKARGGTFFVFGEISYFDAFQDINSAEPHFTRYRFSLPVDDEGIHDGGLLFADEGNESD